MIPVTTPDLQLLSPGPSVACGRAVFPAAQPWEMRGVLVCLLRSDAEAQCRAANPEASNCVSGSNIMDSAVRDETSNRQPGLLTLPAERTLCC